MGTFWAAVPLTSVNAFVCRSSRVVGYATSGGITGEPCLFVAHAELSNSRKRVS